MKRNYPLLYFILFCISLLSGKLTAGVSLVGRFGINLFYKEYRFFKVWWQSALVCLGVLLALTLILFVIDKSLKGTKRKLVLLLFFFISLVGLYLTFRDFRQDLSHRWLGERFHIGIYLYWIGFCIISLFYALTEKNTTSATKKIQ